MAYIFWIHWSHCLDHSAEWKSWENQKPFIFHCINHSRGSVYYDRYMKETLKLPIVFSFSSALFIFSQVSLSIKTFPLGVLTLSSCWCWSSIPHIFDRALSLVKRFENWFLVSLSFSVLGQVVSVTEDELQSTKFSWRCKMGDPVNCHICKDRSIINSWTWHPWKLLAQPWVSPFCWKNNIGKTFSDHVYSMSLTFFSWSGLDNNTSEVFLAWSSFSLSH